MTTTVRMSCSYPNCPVSRIIPRTSEMPEGTVSIINDCPWHYGWRGTHIVHNYYDEHGNQLPINGMNPFKNVNFERKLGDANTVADLRKILDPFIMECVVRSDSKSSIEVLFKFEEGESYLVLR